MNGRVVVTVEAGVFPADGCVTVNTPALKVHVEGFTNVCQAGPSILKTVIVTCAMFPPMQPNSSIRRKYKLPSRSRYFCSVLKRTTVGLGPSGTAKAPRS